MIELLLKLVEKLTALAQHASAHKRRGFKELAEPMFTELLEVHKNYMQFFAEAQSLSLKHPADATIVIDYLGQKRLEFQPVRTKIETLARTLYTLHAAKKPSQMADFLYAVIRYFPVGDIYTDDSSASTTLLDILIENSPIKRNASSVRKAVARDPFPYDFLGGPSEPTRAEQEATEVISRQWPSFSISTSAIIELFIQLQQAKWQGTCDAFANLKAADLRLD
jgi:hypothetical protein